MKSVEEFVQEYRATVQAAVPDEEVLAVAVLSRPGAMAGTIGAQVSGGFWLLNKMMGKRKSAGLPTNVVLGVTPTAVHVFGFAPKMSSIVLKQHAAVWPRAGMTVTAVANRLAVRLTFRLADGSVVELDSNKGMGDYARLNDAFLNTLGVHAGV